MGHFVLLQSSKAFRILQYDGKIEFPAFPRVGNLSELEFLELIELKDPCCSPSRPPPREEM